MIKTTFSLILTSILLFASAAVYSQEQPPAPGASRSAAIPAVREKRLPNGLNVGVIRKMASPIVTIQLVVKNGASAEPENKAGLADITAAMLTKGTKTRTATQIAEAIEFLGGSIASGANWNSSFVSVTVTSDKVSQAIAILADVVLNPKFDQDELDLLKSQTLDGLTYNLKQPSFLANYVASKYSFGEHPAGGTRDSITSITRDDVVGFKSANYLPSNAVLIFSGAISDAAAMTAASQSFSVWKSTRSSKPETGLAAGIRTESRPEEMIKRLLVVDLPKAGQAAVAYSKRIYQGRVACRLPHSCSSEKEFFPAVVLNSVFGGGYSSRLNYEIRIKRGLSYGAGSSFAWRSSTANFATGVQTKNESAAEVVELILAELKRMTDQPVAGDELVPRKSVLTGGFGRSLETTSGLASSLGSLYAFDLPTSDLNSYVASVNSVTSAQIKDFAAQYLPGGDVIIVGDYAIFKDDLAKRFPALKVDVVGADDIDLSKQNLRK
jgi:zinc protease